MSSPIRQVVVVGGGSAGWLTAGVIAAEHGKRLKVILIESPDVNPIGVGEGTWPTMRDTLRGIGVSETDFIRACDASFKQGTEFRGWVTGERGDDFFHPFVLPQGYTEANLVSRWHERHPDTPFAEQVSYQPHLCRQGKAPKQVTTPEFAAVANYAYHLDAGKFGQFLKHHCTEKLGVRYIRDHVRGINPAENGDIESLDTGSSGYLPGDLFIDCTGFAAILLGRHYGVPFISRKDVLFSDRALALQVPYADESLPIASHTISTAQRAGWIWDIGLSSRRGVGHVYSSAHTTDQQAEDALFAYIEQSGGSTGQLATPRRISIDPGHRERFWHRNCVAVGLSAGFIEPLEASALVLVELSAAMIRDDMPPTRELMDIVARRFNDRFRYRWDRVIEFLKLHYLLTQREDSDFWLDNCDLGTVPGRLQELLALWRFRPPSRYDFPQVEEIFPSASHQYILYGMGFNPDSDTTEKPSDAPQLADGFFEERARLTAKLLAGLPANRELVNHVRTHGLQRI